MDAMALMAKKRSRRRLFFGTARPRTATLDALPKRGGKHPWYLLSDHFTWICQLCGINLSFSSHFISSHAKTPVSLPLLFGAHVIWCPGHFTGSISFRVGHSSTCFNCLEGCKGAQPRIFCARSAFHFFPGIMAEPWAFEGPLWLFSFMGDDTTQIIYMGIMVNHCKDPY